ncbi:hypothetical protein Tco_1132765 [Tanacetum coccineum]|uniref:Tf2-1-like SH3-like domain-containing protein n=1 Tax=Tanacetum coccineum TaxID=301880 RepID=A0ABQ5JDI4_9ASTR
MNHHRKKGIEVPTEREFRGYYALLKLDKHPCYKLSHDLAKMTHGIRQATEVLFARKPAELKGEVRFGKRGKLNPRYVGPFKVLEKVGSIAYKLELPHELSRVHNTFHFVKEPIEITDRAVKRLKRSRISLVKVQWNSKRGLEFTWEHEDQFRKKHPHLFTKTAPSSSAAS